MDGPKLSTLVPLEWPHQDLSIDNKIISQFEKKCVTKNSPAIITNLVKI